MKIKLDENIPISLAEQLTEIGHDVETVFQEGMAGCDDDFLWQRVQLEGRFLITQDLDFSDFRKFQPGKHHGILLVRLGNPGRQALVEKMTSIFQSEDTEHWKKCFVVITDRKIRIISRPTQ